MNTSIAAMWLFVSSIAAEAPHANSAVEIPQAVEMETTWYGWQVIPVFLVLTIPGTIADKNGGSKTLFLSLAAPVVLFSGPLVDWMNDAPGNMRRSLVVNASMGLAGLGLYLLPRSQCREEGEFGACFDSVEFLSFVLLAGMPIVNMVMGFKTVPRKRDVSFTAVPLPGGMTFGLAGTF